MSEQHKQHLNDVVESTPPFRSVSMLQPAQQVGLISARHDYIDGGIKRSTPTPEILSYSKDPISTNTNQTPPPNTNAGMWNVTKLMKVPPFYKLERTHVRISEDVPLEEVQNRIIGAIRNESVAAVYDSVEVRLCSATRALVGSLDS